MLALTLRAAVIGQRGRANAWPYQPRDIIFLGTTTLFFGLAFILVTCWAGVWRGMWVIFGR